MVEEHLTLGEDGAESRAQRWRVWLRRVMPRVAIAAAVLFVARLILDEMPLYRETYFGVALELVAIPVIWLTVCYYGYKGLRWLRRHLLWRVRRRLAITYLFIGLTPIILLTVLGLLFAVSTSVEGMARLVTMQVTETEKETMANARVLADALAQMPPATDDGRIKVWLDERTAQLQASLPGARVAVWRSGGAGERGGGAGEGGGVRPLGYASEARFVSEPADENTRGVGDDRTSLGAPLPGWLEEREEMKAQGEWSGLVFAPPSGGNNPFGSPSVRALVRRGDDSGQQPLVLEVSVPVSRALVHKYSDVAGIRIHPFFIARDDINININEGTVDAKADEKVDERVGAQVDEQLERLEGVGRGTVGETEKAAAQAGATLPTTDQFGEQMKPSFSPVTLMATDWLTGETEQHLGFMIGWSFTEASRQTLGASPLGQVLRNVLIGVGLFFLFLELLAVIAAAWMTRAVTGTVHKLYQATEFIKRGDFSHRVQVRSHDQLGELATAFNDMSANIESLLNERVLRERLEREVEIAADVQAQLFPHSVPHLATVETAGECRAARGVAGDYYDYIEVAPGLVAFALGDVSGKGISASLVMSNLQATLRAQTTIVAERLKLAGQVAAATAATTTTASASTASVTAAAAAAGELGAELPCGVTGVDTQCAVENMVESVNWQLCRSTDANRFASLFLALYDDRQRLLRYTNAGHNDALLLRADGTVERLSKGGTLVGAFDWSSYEEAQTTLRPGDLLIIFSDGISEAQNILGEEYGEERLEQFALTQRGRSADEILHRIFEEIDNWSGEQERGDDQTLVIVKCKSE